MTIKNRWQLPTSIFYLIAAGIILLDQLTKTLVREKIPLNESVTIIPHLLSFTHTTNTGASFSLFTNYSFFLTVIAIAVIFAITLFYRLIPREYKLSFALILGGTAGNLFDRIFFGRVTDFFDIHIFSIFNIADSAITLAAVLLIIAVYQEEKEMKER